MESIYKFLYGPTIVRVLRPKIAAFELLLNTLLGLLLATPFAFILDGLLQGLILTKFQNATWYACLHDYSCDSGTGLYFTVSKIFLIACWLFGTRQICRWQLKSAKRNFDLLESQAPLDSEVGQQIGKVTTGMAELSIPGTEALEGKESVTPINSIHNSNDAGKRLKRLQTLKESGIITEKEYIAKRTEILKLL